jgi:hypothetical protein
MNLPNHQILTTNPGVLAVLSAPVTAAGDEIPDMTTYGAERWHPIMRGTALLLRHTQEPELRVVVGDHLVIVQIEGEQIVVVVVASAHAINKSIHRMIRRSVKPSTPPRERPVAPPRPRSKAAETTRQARPTPPPADPIAPASFDILSETRRAVASDTPRTVRTPDPTPAIEMPRGDQW